MTRWFDQLPLDWGRIPLKCYIFCCTGQFLCPLKLLLPLPLPPLSCSPALAPGSALLLSSSLSLLLINGTIFITGCWWNSDLLFITQRAFIFLILTPSFTCLTRQCRRNPGLPWRKLPFLHYSGSSNVSRGNSLHLPALGHPHVLCPWCINFVLFLSLKHYWFHPAGRVYKLFCILTRFSHNFHRQKSRGSSLAFCTPLPSVVLPWQSTSQSCQPSQLQEFSSHLLLKIFYKP